MTGDGLSTTRVVSDVLFPKLHLHPETQGFDSVASLPATGISCNTACLNNDIWICEECGCEPMAAIFAPTKEYECILIMFLSECSASAITGYVLFIIYLIAVTCVKDGVSAGRCDTLATFPIWSVSQPYSCRPRL